MKKILIVAIAAASFSDAGVSVAQIKWVTPARTETRTESGQRVKILTGAMTIVAPGRGESGTSSVVLIDARDFTKGTLEIEFKLGNGASDGSFGLDSQKNRAAPRDQEDSWVRVGQAYDRPKGSTHKLTHAFTEGGLFRFTGQGNWFSKKGSTNTVFYCIQIKSAASGTPCVSGTPSTLRFVRQKDQGFEAIQTVRHGEPFFVEARFDAEPPQGERTVSLEWGDGQRREVAVLKTSDPKIFRSRVMTVERPGETTVVRP